MTGPLPRPAGTGLDQVVAALAAEQDGIVGRAQLSAMGCTDDWVEARLRSGRWQRVHPGTYAVFTGPLPFRARLFLSCSCRPSAGSAAFPAVAAWVSRACGRRLTTPARLRLALAGRRRHRWRRDLLDLLADVGEGAQSLLEVRYLRSVERAHRLPPGVRQRRLVGRRVAWIDVDHDEFATRVELDGRLARAADAVRSNLLAQPMTVDDPPADTPEDRPRRPGVRAWNSPWAELSEKSSAALDEARHTHGLR